MTSDADETGDMIVVTLVVPPSARDELSVAVREHTVTVSAPGYSRELPLAAEADTGRLHAQLYGDFLELRAPRCPAPADTARPVPVQRLR
jgi:HSP20 family molecular chaperone IbpA